MSQTRYGTRALSDQLLTTLRMISGASDPDLAHPQNISDPSGAYQHVYQALVRVMIVAGWGPVNAAKVIKRALDNDLTIVDAAYEVIMPRS